MSMLLFMPWCPIDDRYEVGDISILSFERNAPLEGLDDLTQRQINTIMGTRKDIHGNPMQRVAVVRYGSKSLTDNLDDEEIEAAYELVSLACFSGLAQRNYFNQFGAYCNSGCFTFHVQKFDTADATALVIRRREGRTLSAWSFDDLSITIPVHCHTVREVSLDKALLGALANHRTQLSGDKWGRWQNAISCFNQANTDSDNVGYKVEWVLLCSAFEHLLKAKPDAKDVARLFVAAMTPSQNVLASKAARRSDKRQDPGLPLRYEWMREFYRIRGDFAHGKLNSRQPVVWNPLEHLVLASIAFPLVVKSLLAKTCEYKMTDDDLSQIDCFETFADTKDFLKPPPDQEGSLDSHWSRLVSKCALERLLNRAMNGIAPEQWQCPEQSAGKEPE